MSVTCKQRARTQMVATPAPVMVATLEMEGFVKVTGLWFKRYQSGKVGCLVGAHDRLFAWASRSWIKDWRMHVKGQWKVTIRSHTRQC